MVQLGDLLLILILILLLPYVLCHCVTSCSECLICFSYRYQTEGLCARTPTLDALSLTYYLAQEPQILR